jgi:hypothetical protein
VRGPRTAEELILIEVTPWSTAVEIQGPGDFFRCEGRNMTPAAKQRLRRRFRRMVERGSTE